MSLGEPAPRDVSTPGAARWSIAGRLTLWYAASASLLVALSTAVLYWVLVTNVDRQDDQFLVDTVQILRALIRERPDDIAALQQEVEWEGAVRRYTRMYVRIRDSQDRMLLETAGTSRVLGTNRVRAASVDAEPGPGTDIRSAAGTPYRVIAAWAGVGLDSRSPRLIEAVLDRTADEALLRTYRTRAWSVLGLVLFASGVAGYVMARRAMRPIEAIAETARGVGSTTLGARIPIAALPAELASLASTFNQMLTRLEDAFTRLSSFSADLAHELRTPINNLRGEVEVALGKPREAADYRATLESVLEECGRLSQMIDGLMFLARADRPETEIVRTRVDIDQELRTVSELFEPLASEGGVAIEVEEGAREARVVALDRSLFQRALSNLMTNALRHTPAGGRVKLTARFENGLLEVEVSDTGSGIPAEHLARVSDRFYRADPSRSSTSGGLGLGLAIVQSIMRVHGGSVEIASEQDRGATVRLSFPVAGLPLRDVPA